MRRISSMKLLVGMAVLSWAGLQAGGGGAGFPTLKKVKVPLEKGTLSITKKDVDVTLKGRVRQDWLGYDKIYTLRASNADQLSGFRTKACIDFAATYGRQTYGRSAADALLRVTNYGYWKGEGYYTPFADNGERSLNLLSYVEQAWVNLHFGTFWKAYDNWISLEDHPISLKIGYLPYQLGRGISLGDAFIHLPYLGLDSFGYDSTRSDEPGILIHGYINKDISYDFYYSKRYEKSLSRVQTWEKIRSNRTDCVKPYRGIAKDWDLWAIKMDLTHMKRWGDIHVQPYMLYLDAPETTIETRGDSCMRLGTAGMMLEYQKGRFTINAEIAGQYGHQRLYPIDRNVLQEITDDETHTVGGVRIETHSHVFYTDALTEDPSINDGMDVNSFAFRGGCDPTTGLFVPAVTRNGYSDDGFNNSNVTGNARFRDGYKINLRGFMGVVDMKYDFEDVPVSVSAAGAYISGDHYPYNEERCKCYKGFIPLGDYDYIGEFVQSHIMLEARKLPRPVDISWHDQYAHNNVKDCSNLAYLGAGVKWHPFKDKKKLMMRSNILWYWETITLKKWDKHQPLPGKKEVIRSAPPAYESTKFKGDKSWRICEETGIWIKSSSCPGVPEEDHHVGWMTCDNASRMLGTELNFEIQYRPVQNCIFLMQLACLIPGQLYKDLDGQPNERTINGPKAAEGVYGLGHDPVWRVALSLDYRF